MADYFRPASLPDALQYLARQPCQILAGGTDVYPQDSALAAWGKPMLNARDAKPVLDITGINALRGIRSTATDWRIGATTTWREVIAAASPPWLAGLRAAAGEIGGIQIQNQATIGGNLGNASPAADGIPPLLVLDARIEIESIAGRREMMLRDFLTGPRQTALQPNELLTSVIVPKPDETTTHHSVFLKLGARRYLVISIVMGALQISVDSRKRIKTIAIAIGACAATAKRLPTLEQRLVGQPIAVATENLRASDFAHLQPIDDIRASAEYRRHAAQVLVKRGLERLASTTESTPAMPTDSDFLRTAL